MQKNKLSSSKLKEYDEGFESINYTSNPNLIFKENIINNFHNDYWIFDNYDIYYLESQNKDYKFDVFIVYPCSNNDNINILRIHDKKLITSLEGHESTVDIVKHFYDDSNKKRYLLSSDYSKLVIVWDITKYYNKINKICTEYTQYITSLLIIFEKNYVITSTDGTSENDLIKIYSLNNGKLLSSIHDTNKNETRYLLKWYYNNNYYLIRLCHLKILIYDLSFSKIYKILPVKLLSSVERYFYSGFVTNDNKYLYTCSNKGGIYIYNLLNSTLIYCFMIKKTYSFKIALWSSFFYNSCNNNDKKIKTINNYILVSDNYKKGFICVNITFDRIIKDSQENDFNFKYNINTIYKNGKNIKCFKKIIHPIYGECLLCSGDNSNIDLWINK